MNAQIKLTNEEKRARVKEREARRARVREVEEINRAAAIKAREERLKKLRIKKAESKKQRQEVTKAIIAREGPTPKQQARHELYLKQRAKMVADRIAAFRSRNKFPEGTIVNYDIKTNRFKVTSAAKVKEAGVQGESQIQGAARGEGGKA